MLNLRESVIDPAQASLSKHVFKDGKLLPHVRFKILHAWGLFNKIGPTGQVLIVGSIGTLNYTQESDIDVTIKWLGPEGKLKEVRNLANRLNGTVFAGPHEINYFIRPDIHPDYYDSIYDVIGDRWLKGPAEVGVDVDTYMQKFEEIVSDIDLDKAELLADLADYKAIQGAKPAERERAAELAREKLAEIESDVEKLSGQYLEIRSARHRAFDEADLERIKEYGRRNALPENVIYLLLRRYCYLHFLHSLTGIASNGVERSELDDIEDAYENFGTCERKKGFAESLAISLGSIE